VKYSLLAAMQRGRQLNSAVTAMVFSAKENKDKRTL